MSNLPKLVLQIAITGTQIFGKAFLAAGQQAVKNAKYRPGAEAGGDGVASTSNAPAGSLTDRLTREHRMTLDEAHLILNAKRESPMEEITKHYEYLFKANSPPAPPSEADAKAAAPTTRTASRRVQPAYSHYLQSKVVRALERIKAEQAGEPVPVPGTEGADVAQGTKVEGGAPPPPPPPQA